MPHRTVSKVGFYGRRVRVEELVEEWIVVYVGLLSISGIMGFWKLPTSLSTEVSAMVGWETTN